MNAAHRAAQIQDRTAREWLVGSGGFTEEEDNSVPDGQHPLLAQGGKGGGG